MLDLVGGSTQERSFQVLKQGGCLVSTVHPPSHQLAQEHRVRAVMMSMKPSKGILSQLSLLLDEGVIKPALRKIYPIFRAAEAWRDLSSQHTAGKIVLKMV